MNPKGDRSYDPTITRYTRYLTALEYTASKSVIIIHYIARYT